MDQLERLQRLRAGDDVPPALKMNLEVNTEKSVIADPEASQILKIAKQTHFRIATGTLVILHWQTVGTFR